LVVIASVTIVAAQSVIRGTWTAEVKSKYPNELQLNLYRSSKMQMGHSMPISELQGLDATSAQAPNKQVQFKLVRDAGIVEFTGTFNEGLGHGEFNFTSNPEYVAGMRQLGFDDVEHKSFELAMLDVSRAYANEIRSLGYKPDLDGLIQARIFKVDRAQVEGMRAIGVTDLPLEKLVQYRIFNVTPEYVREMRTSFPNLSLEKLVEMRIHKATPEFAKEMASLGYGNLNADQLIAFRIHGVTPEFIREVGELGFKSLDADQLVQFRIFGVNAEQIRDLAKEGYTNMSAQQLVAFRIHHVDTAFIEKVKKAGYTHPSPDQLVQFKIMGIRVREADL
jgi:hypothetical protein